MVHELHHRLEIFECNILEDDYRVLGTMECYFFWNCLAYSPGMGWQQRELGSSLSKQRAPPDYQLDKSVDKISQFARLLPINQKEIILHSVC